MWRLKEMMFKAGNSACTQSGHTVLNQDINIYPKSFIFISDQAIYQRKEKNKTLDKNTKDSEKAWFIPNFSPRLC